VWTARRLGPKRPLLFLPPEPPEMRAEIESLVDAAKQSIGLLRRHL
jgi:hypothetical protein